MLLKIFKFLSVIAVKKAIRENSALNEVWKESFNTFPSFHDHFGTIILDDEAELRIRMLISAQVVFLKKVIDELPEADRKLNFLDVGDSDGSLRLLFEKKYPKLLSENLGINLQQSVVDEMNRNGLKAECIDAMDLHKQNRKYDLVSVFETMEHLPNPIGFLENISMVVKDRLIISVPLIANSRLNLGYLDPKWPKSKTPTIATTHIFELDPEDLKKIFWHTGWEIDFDWRVRPFPKYGPLNWILKFIWRRISFEGWYFVSLKRNEKFSSQYKIE